MSPELFTSMFGVFAQLSIVLSGFCLMLSGIIPGMKRFALRLFLFGIFLAVIGSIGYQWVPME